MAAAYPSARHEELGIGSTPEPRSFLRRALAAALAAVTAIGLTVAGASPAALADQPRRSIAQGITAAGGLLVDPANRLWVSDSQRGFCRIVETSGSTQGSIEAATCLGGSAGAPQKGPAKPGAPALLDPSPQTPGSGDELALVPDAAANSSFVMRARWDAPTGTFRYASTLTIYGGDLRPVAVSVGPDRNAYVVFERARSVVRIASPASTQPTLQTVASLGANGARAIAAGAADSTGKLTVYVAEASGLTSFRPPLSGSSMASTTASFAVGAVARLHFDPATSILYAGKSAATVAGGDSITRVVTPTGQVEANWAAGFTRIGGIAVRKTLVLAADDPGLLASPAQIGKGFAYLLGEILPRIVAGPTMADGSPAPDPAFTNDATPTFTVAVDGGESLQCAFDNANWAGCAVGDVTASQPLSDGAHRFAVRVGATGTPVEAAFTVDTASPATPTIVTPATGSTVGGSVVLNITAEAGAVLRCAVDAALTSPGTVCRSGDTLTFTTSGSHSLRVTATDRVGNVSAPVTSTFTVDLTAPTPVITAPAADGQTLTGTATFEFSAGSASGLTYRCRIDAQPFEACTSPKSYTTLSAGAHTFVVEARSAVGNTGTATRTFQFAVPDATAPVVSASPVGGTYDAGQQITLTANEAATIYFTTNGDNPTTASAQYSAPIALTADFTLRYFAVDTAGNASAPVSQAYVVRTTPPPTRQPHDYDGDGKVDVIALSGTGDLWLYRGDGSGGWLGWRVIASGWNDVNAIITPGDWTGDGNPDLLARTTGGELRLYRGDNAGSVGGPEVVATGWAGYSMLFSPGDWDGDGKSDILARDSSGRLMLIPGNGAGGVMAPRQVGSGWQGMTAIFGPGDWDGDGKADVITREGSGRLVLYPGNGSGGWLATRQIGTGWSNMTAIFGPGDLNGDGKPDVVARDNSGHLLLYPGNGTGGWLQKRQIGSGWGGMTVII
ncbi:VCBS repeat-containing protein [Streptomyces sp. ISL-90]|nr:VCBS repeat-containing protein [Streptomyces sp. ISL-90]